MDTNEAAAGRAAGPAAAPASAPASAPVAAPADAPAVVDLTAQAANEASIDSFHDLLDLVDAANVTSGSMLLIYNKILQCREWAQRQEKQKFILLKELNGALIDSAKCTRELKASTVRLDKVESALHSLSEALAASHRKSESFRESAKIYKKEHEICKNKYRDLLLAQNKMEEQQEALIHQSLGGKAKGKHKRKLKRKRVD